MSNIVRLAPEAKREPNPDVVDMLELALTRARSGELTSLAMVYVRDGVHGMQISENAELFELAGATLWLQHEIGAMIKIFSD